jgi:dTDP-4-amino-4,6-dideoxy-D-galactose acyltransferase
MIKEFLDWDSYFFGFPVEKIVLEQDFQPSEFLSLIRESTAAVTYIFTPVVLNSEQDSAIHAAAAVKYDVKTTFAKTITGIPLAAAAERITGYSPDLEQLAWHAGAFSRYNLDPGFRPYFRPLYSKWLDNALNEAGSIVLAVKESGKITGMVTVMLGNTDGTIGLLAVAPEFRGRGFGEKLLNAALDFCAEHNKINCSVTTQQINIPACRLYSKSGFNIIKQETVWHLWHKNNKNQ